MLFFSREARIERDKSNAKRPSCEHCGTEIIYDCYVCGAPLCCPKCCAEATRELKEH